MKREFSMIAKHVNNKRAEDIIFALNREANNAAMEFGKENVVNATVGSILDEKEKLAVIPSVMETLRNISTEDFAAYAPIIGTSDYLEAAIQTTFKNYRPDGYIKAVATPGGSGAIRQTIWNYSDIGDTILTSDWYWGPYKTLAEENLRKLTVFTFFDKEKYFNIQSFESKVRELLGVQERILIILNSPAQNPTGFALTDDEWGQVIEVIKKEAKDKSKRITLLCDIAYIDYAGSSTEVRKFMKLFSGLPENVLVVVAFSMSKGYTMYGLRTGAAICVSSSKDIAQEFQEVVEASNRGTWSNGTRCGMKLLSTIINNSELSGKVDSERESLRKLLVERAEMFIKEAKENELGICPYKAGFFVTIPTEKPEGSCELLKKERVFAVPIAKGIRFAVCSVPTYKISGIARKIKNAIDANA